MPHFLVISGGKEKAKLRREEAFGLFIGVMHHLGDLSRRLAGLMEGLGETLNSGQESAIHNLSELVSVGPDPGAMLEDIELMEDLILLGANLFGLIAKALRDALH